MSIQLDPKVVIQYDPTKIAALRRSEKLTLKKFGHLMETSSEAVRKWEAKEHIPQVGTLVKMMNLFGLEPEYFFRVVKRK